MNTNRHHITLDNDYLRMVIDINHGASILSLLYLPTQTHILRPSPTIIHDVRQTACYPLAPVCGRIDHGRFFWQGQYYQLPANIPPEPHYIHGHAWRTSQWDVIEHHHDLLVVLSRDDMGWAFPYQVEIQYQLHHTSIEATITVKNLDKFSTPVGIGFHPFFIKYPHSRIQTNAKKIMLVNDMMMPTGVMDDNDLLNALNNEEILSHHIDNCFSSWSRQAIIDQGNFIITLNASDNLSCLHCYTPIQDSFSSLNFFCVEPVSHMPNAINISDQYDEDACMNIIAPNAELSGKMQLCYQSIS